MSVLSKYLDQWFETFRPKFPWFVCTSQSRGCVWITLCRSLKTKLWVFFFKLVVKWTKLFGLFGWNTLCKCVKKSLFFSFLGDLRWNFSKYFHFCEKLCAPCDDSQTQIGPVSQQPQLWYSYLYKPSLIARLKLSNLISSRCRDKRRRFRFAISRYQKLKCCCIFFFWNKIQEMKKTHLIPGSVSFVHFHSCRNDFQSKSLCEINTW